MGLLISGPPHPAAGVPASALSPGGERGRRFGVIERLAMLGRRLGWFFFRNLKKMPILVRSGLKWVDKRKKSGKLFPIRRITLMCRNAPGWEVREGD